MASSSRMVLIAVAQCFASLNGKVPKRGKNIVLSVSLVPPKGCEYPCGSSIFVPEMVHLFIARTHESTWAEKPYISVTYL